MNIVIECGKCVYYVRCYDHEIGKCKKYDIYVFMDQFCIYDNDVLDVEENKIINQLYIPKIPEELLNEIPEELTDEEAIAKIISDSNSNDVSIKEVFESIKDEVLFDD